MRIATEPQLVGSMLLAALCTLLIGAFSSGTDVVNECSLAQTWSNGDQHLWQTVELREDASGEWTQDGFDSDAPHGHKLFRWSATGSTFTVTFSDGTHKSVNYTLTPRRAHCYLEFDSHPFVPDRTGILLLSNRPQ